MRSRFCMEPGKLSLNIKSLDQRQFVLLYKCLLLELPFIASQSLNRT